MRIKYEILACCQGQEADVLQECLVWAVQIARQTELVADCGILLYLQDTSATRLSNYGTMLYKVSYSHTELTSSCFGGLVRLSSVQPWTC